MTDHDMLAARFEEHRSHLRGAAYRMLGSLSEADDAVQEAWLRLSRSDASRVENLRGWLTTVVSRVCLDMLRARQSRREEPLDAPAGDRLKAVGSACDPEEEALLADSVGLALLVVLESLAPAERVAFVLHDVFAVPFNEIAPIVDRTPDAARQLASRARRRVRGADTATGADLSRHRAVVEAFLAAARDGDFAGLLAVLDPDVVLRVDRTAMLLSASRRAGGAPIGSPEVRGASVVADTFSGRADAARPALIDGAAGAVWGPRGTPRVALRFTIASGRIVAIDVVADPERVRALDVRIL